MSALAADLARALDPVALAASPTTVHEARAVVSGRLLELEARLAASLGNDQASQRGTVQGGGPFAW